MIQWPASPKPSRQLEKLASRLSLVLKSAPSSPPGYFSHKICVNIIHKKLIFGNLYELLNFINRTESGSEEPVHVLAYYSSCGPSNFEKLDQFLANIREGRYLRAKNMILKLNKLKLPIRWESVEKIAGDGVAPGRLHVARAMVEAGHVENLKQAFSRYLYDGGPAYST